TCPAGSPNVAITMETSRKRVVIDYPPATQGAPQPSLETIFEVAQSKGSRARDRPAPDGIARSFAAPRAPCDPWENARSGPQRMRSPARTAIARIELRHANNTRCPRRDDRGNPG